MIHHMRHGSPPCLMAPQPIDGRTLRKSPRLLQPETVSTGMWDAVHRPTPAEKTLPWPTQALCPIPHVLVQAGPAAHPHLPSSDDPPPTSLDRMAHPPN